jgi:peptidoglycan/xylan/chitin deacetylase (PgdA/CDA1 family)
MTPLLWTLPLLAGSGLLARAVFAPTSSMLYPTVSRLNGPDARVALTFDDGPWPGSTDLILDELARTNSHATFFVIGRYAAEQPGLIQRMHDEGHQIGNHTFDHHRDGLLRGEPYWREQLARTDEVIAKITGVRPGVFRPPMGFKAPPQARALRRTELRVVAWSRRTFDGILPSADRIARVGERLTSGDILLLHDGRDPASRRAVGAAAQALPALLSCLQRRGLTPVRVDEGL